MTSIKLLNDPEYRWYHKEEMSKIMPFTSERKRLGIKVIDYEFLRDENDKKIKLCTDRDFDWDTFKSVVDRVPDDCNKLNSKKVSLQPKDRLHFERRDMGKCYICDQVNHYGSNNNYSLYTYNSYSVSQLHHIIPNGETSDRNIITLCVHCHQLVHQALYLTGKWRYSRPI